MTTNLPFESWTEVLGSERLTGATLDRLTHRCRIIETKGESYRLTRRQGPDPAGAIQVARPACGRRLGLKVVSRPKCCRFRPVRAAGFDRCLQVFLSDVDVQQTISRQPARVKVRSSSSGRWSVNLFERSPSIR